MPDISIEEYESNIASTDQFEQKDLNPVLKGLFGEVGSLITTSKKLQREGKVYLSYSLALNEEAGDVFWYLAALCRRKKYDLEEIINQAGPQLTTQSRLVASHIEGVVINREYKFDTVDEPETYLFDLGMKVALLLESDLDSTEFRNRLISFVTTYLMFLQSSKLTLGSILKSNQAKTLGRFVETKASLLPVFDVGFGDDESLPKEFKIEVHQKTNGKSYLKWNGVFIGDPLTDNIADADGYRFHDVFHFAHAAILHWSPVFRALIKHKRKSRPEIDENQDSGRAIVIEEGISAYVFSYAKQMDFFEGQERISFDLLKTVSNFTKGYEVDRCPLYQWEQAILQGYKVFRQLREAEKGIVVGNLTKRTIKFEKLP